MAWSRPPRSSQLIGRFDRKFPSRQIDKRAARRHGKLRAAGPRAGLHAFEHRHLLAGHLEPIEIEWGREHGSVAHVDQMSARQIPPVAATAVHDFSSSLRYRLHDDVRAVERAGGLSPR